RMSANQSSIIDGCDRANGARPVFCVVSFFRTLDLNGIYRYGPYYACQRVGTDRDKCLPCPERDALTDQAEKRARAVVILSLTPCLQIMFGQSQSPIRKLPSRHPVAFDRSAAMPLGGLTLYL